MPAPDHRIALLGTLGMLQDAGVIASVEVRDDWTFVIDGRLYDADGAARLVELRRSHARRRLARRFARDHAALAQHRVAA